MYCVVPGVKPGLILCVASAFGLDFDFRGLGRVGKDVGTDVGRVLMFGLSLDLGKVGFAFEFGTNGPLLDDVGSSSSSSDIEITLALPDAVQLGPTPGSTFCTSLSLIFFGLPLFLLTSLYPNNPKHSSSLPISFGCGLKYDALFASLGKGGTNTWERKNLVRGCGFDFDFDGVVGGRTEEVGLEGGRG